MIITHLLFIVEEIPLIVQSSFSFLGRCVFPSSVFVLCVAVIVRFVLSHLLTMIKWLFVSPFIGIPSLRAWHCSPEHVHKAKSRSKPVIKSTSVAFYDVRLKNIQLTSQVSDVLMMMKILVTYHPSAHDEQMFLRRYSRRFWITRVYRELTQGNIAQPRMSTACGERERERRGEA